MHVSIQFTHEDYRPWYVHIAHRLRRMLRSFLLRPVDLGSSTLLSRYTYHPNAAYKLPSAYLLLEDVNTPDNQVLRKTWAVQREEPGRQQNLFRGLARIMLSLARVPLPRIGAFSFRDDGTIALVNRPLDCSMAIFENENTPRAIPCSQTYSGTEAYVADLFRLHTQRFLSHPNAVFNERDCRGQMAAWVLLRSIADCFILPEQRNGPFFLQLTDLHPGNIFVDKAWNITYIIDLEWMCALPIEMLNVPYWLTDQDIGGLQGDALRRYEAVWQMFMAILKEEESRIATGHSLTDMLRISWRSGGIWFWLGLTSVNGMVPLFKKHLRQRFSPIIFRNEEEVISRFFSEGADIVVHNKLNAYHQYAEDLKKLFV